ncbi:MAG: septal ring lytic transglycosylase RlpA family protein [Alphaproteobacteria bacterium]
MFFCLSAFNRGLSIFFLMGMLLLTGCASLDECQTFSPQRATSRPYQIKGAWYYPQHHYELEETGVASYYGGVDGCHGLPTATGEPFDMYQLTAAHKTLPLPSVVLVTNLENGRMLKLKVNDRGPFKNNRVLDVSVRAAQLLGFYAKGTAMVQIQALAEESISLPENVRAFARQEGRKSGVKLASRSVKKRPTLLASKPASEDPSLISPATASPLSQKQPHTSLSIDHLIKPLPASPQSVEGVLKQAISAKDPAIETAGVKAKTGHPHLYIQVQTHAFFLDAQKNVRALSLVHKVFIKKQSTSHGALYRVMVGPLGHVNEADAILETVFKHGYTQARISIER